MSLEIVERSSGYWIVDKSGIVCDEPFIDLSDAISQLNRTLLYDWMSSTGMETSEELMLSCPRLHVSSARKIMEEHNFEPYVIWGKETGQLLVEMMHQEVICRVDDNGRVNTKTVLEWLGY